MSLYIGKDNIGDSILHITSETQTETEMKSGIVNSTIFHSKEGLVTIKKYSSISMTGSTSDMYVEFPAEGIEYLHSTSPRLIFQVVVNGKVHDYLKWANNVDGMMFWYNAVNGNYSTDPEPGYRFIRIGNSTTINSVELLVFNVDVEGNTYHPIPQTNDILIDSTQVSIGSIDISSINYVVTPPVNTSDYSFFDSNGIQTQIINTTTPSSGVSFNMQSPISVHLGSKKILDSTSTFVTLHNSIKETVHKPYASIVLRGGRTTNVQFFTIPTGVSKLIFSMYFPASNVDHTFIVNGSYIKKQFAKYYVGVSIFNLYFYIDGGIVYLRSEASGSSSDTLTFIEGYYYLLYK